MSATLTSFRQAVASAVATQLGITSVVNGRVDGPIKERDLVCSWPEGKRGQSGGDVNLEELEVQVRVLKQFRQQVDEHAPLDPAPLEDIVDAIQTSLTGEQSSSGPWFFLIPRIEVDTDRQTVTATVVGVASNMLAQT